MLDKEKYLTPREIVVELDKYIIGQDDAKRNVAIALLKEKVSDSMKFIVE